jgi:N-acetylglucosamine repressor
MSRTIPSAKTSSGGARARRRPHTATPSTVRDVNRSIVLTLIRAYQPISRARLSQLTGIFRSNISDIVEQLIAQRLVAEVRAKPSGPGRVPFHLSLNPSGFQAIAISIRPRRTLIGVCGLTGGFETRFSFPTPRHPAHLANRIGLEIKNLRRNLGLLLTPDSVRIAISVPGLVNAESGVIVWAPSLPHYSDFNIVKAVQDRTRLPVAAENDCNLAALAELELAEGEVDPSREVVFVEIGDLGVGGSIIIDRSLYRGHDSTLSAEFGHMVVDPRGPACACGRSGCWELLVSDQATWNRYCPGTPYSARRFDQLLAAVAAGDAAARSAVAETARYLAIGLSNIAFTLNPRTIIVAGRLTEVWPMLEPAVSRGLDASILRVTLQIARHQPEELFLHGAAQLALAPVFARPKIG